MEQGQPTEVDLERTDRLPILVGTSSDDDVEDDAVRMDSVASSAILPVRSVAPGGSQTADFPRASGVDLPSLAESVRSVEERVARQTADYEALKRSYDKTRDAESAAVVRADALATEIAAVRGDLATAQSRAAEIERVLAEKTAAADAASARAEEFARETERHQSGAHRLRDALDARDARIVEALHSLGERDAELNALREEHAEILPALEARAQLEADLQATRSRGDAVADELRTSQAAAASMSVQLKRGEAELHAMRQDLSLAKAQATTYLEQLRTREYRRGFDHNLFRELDARVDASQVGHGALETQRDQLLQQVGELQNRLASQDNVIATLRETAGISAAANAQHAQQLQQGELARALLSDRIEVLEAGRARLESEIASQDAAIAEAHATGTAAVQRVKGALAAMESQRNVLSAQLVVLRDEAEAREVEMAVLVANLQEARRPLLPIEAEVKRLKDELALKNHAVDQLNDDNRALSAALERTKGALAEREFLIRRFERSESNSANVIGRIQTSIERLGTASPSPAAAAPVECSAELIRLNGDQTFPHALGRRTRIGRAAGCEVQIDYSSVSRHHALVLMGPRDVIIEDLNSTNGVIVNGRKITRQLLNDGDLIVIGEVQFRLALRLAPRALEVAGGTPTDGTAVG